jgi:hypothetical protein
MRTAGKFGLLPGKIPVGLKDLTFYVAGSLPAPPPKVDVPAVPSWGMCANDTYGCCGVAGVHHGFMTDAAITSESEPFPTDDQLVSYYLTYTNGQDSGVVLSDFLTHVRSNPYFGHSVDSFAPIAVQDVPTLQTAIDLFGFAYTGIKVTAPMQQAFANHQPWTTDLLNAPVEGGHCIPIVGYDDQFLYAITWGGVQAITYSCWHQIATEAWALISGEFVTANGDGRGIALDALRTDLNRLDA